jgi:hypothetical protein
MEYNVICCCGRPHLPCPVMLMHGLAVHGHDIISVDCQPVRFNSMLLFLPANLLR